MKKVGIVLSLVLLVTLSGCANKTTKSGVEEVMKEYATSYYNNHMAGLDSEDSQIQIAEVSIKMLDYINTLDINNGEEKEYYDLTKLDGCSKDSYVDMEIDQTTKNIKSYEFHMTCK